MKKLMVTAALLLVVGNAIAMQEAGEVSNNRLSVVVKDGTATPEPAVQAYLQQEATQPAMQKEATQPARSLTPVTENFDSIVPSRDGATSLVAPIVKPAISWKRALGRVILTATGASAGGYAGYKAASRFTDKPCLRWAGAVGGALPLGYLSARLASPKAHKAVVPAPVVPVQAQQVTPVELKQ